MALRPGGTRGRLGIAIGVGVVLAIVFAGRWLNVRALAGDIKGDEATYISMAFSLADDGDLRYTRDDFLRFRSLYGHGPEGIFLKQSYHPGFGGTSPVPTSEYLSFGKALIYPAAAAPFVWLGGLGGMLVFNWLLLALCLWLGARFTHAATKHRHGWILGVVFVVASVVPVFGAWLTSEIFNFSLVFVGYYLWLYKRVAPEKERSWLTSGWQSTAVAALLIGTATFSKATNAALVCPMLLEALVLRRWRLIPAVLLAFVLGVGGLFGLNGLITGEANYQGSSMPDGRRYFSGQFPFDDQGTSFERVGHEMVTNDADTGRVLADDALAQIPINTFYFFFGRHAGLVPFYFPGVVLLVVWFATSRHAPVWQWGTFIAIAGSIGALIVFAPDSWNGGGGPPGNRYFLSLYPPLLFLTTRHATTWITAVSVVVGVAFTGAMVAHPFAASNATWENVERRPLRYLPIELTLLNDLPVRLNQSRAPIEFSKAPTVLFYYMLGPAYLPEADGVWVAGRTTSEIVVRTERPLKRVDVRLGTPVQNEVTGSFAGRPISASVGPGRDARFLLSDLRQFRYHDSYAYVLHLATTAGFVPAEVEPTSTDRRNLGVFVRLAFTYADQP